MLSCTTFLVISLKVTRRALPSGRFKSCFKCQEIASPSRSGSVARYTVSAVLADFSRSLMISSFPRMGWYTGSKSCSRSTPRVLLGKSRRWPMQAFTSKSFPRYFPMVLAFAGDSTMTKLCFAISYLRAPSSGACLFPQGRPPPSREACCRFSGCRPQSLSQAPESVFRPPGRPGRRCGGLKIPGRGFTVLNQRRGCTACRCAVSQDFQFPAPSGRRAPAGWEGHFGQ